MSEKQITEDLYIVWYEGSELVRSWRPWPPPQALLLARRLIDRGLVIEAFFTGPPDNARPWRFNDKAAAEFYH